DTGLHLDPVDRAVPRSQRVTRLKEGDLQLRCGSDELIGAVDAAGTSADDNDIKIHLISSFLTEKKRWIAIFTNPTLIVERIGRPVETPTHTAGLYEPYHGSIISSRV